MCARYTHEPTLTDTEKVHLSRAAWGMLLILCMCYADDTTLCHLEPKERSRLRQDMTTFVTHTSSCKPLERSCAITQASALPSQDLWL